jgi:hypothetical protein
VRALCVPDELNKIVSLGGEIKLQNLASNTIHENKVKNYQMIALLDNAILAYDDKKSIKLLDAKTLQES